MPKTPQPSVMKGGQRADRQAPANLVANVGPGGEDLKTIASRNNVSGINRRQAADHNKGVMKVPSSLVKNAPGPKTLATGLDAGGAPRGRGAGAFKGFLGDD